MTTRRSRFFSWMLGLALLVLQPSHAEAQPVAPLCSAADGPFGCTGIFGGSVNMQCPVPGPPTTLRATGNVTFFSDAVVEWRLDPGSDMHLLEPDPVRGTIDRTGRVLVESRQDATRTRKIWSGQFSPLRQAQGPPRLAGQGQFQVIRLDDDGKTVLRCDAIFTLNPGATAALQPTTTAKPCLPALGDEHVRLVQAKAALEEQRGRYRSMGFLDGAARTAISAGVGQLGRTASEAATNLQGLGTGIALAIDEGLKQSIERKGFKGDLEGAARDAELGLQLQQVSERVHPLLQEWGRQFQNKAAATAAIGRSLALSSTDMEQRIDRQLGQIAKRLLGSRNLAEELSCQLPGVPARSAGDASTLILGLHPPLDDGAPGYTYSGQLTNQDVAVVMRHGAIITYTDPWGSVLMVETMEEGTRVSATLPGASASARIATAEATITPRGTAYLVHRDAQRRWTFVYVGEGSVEVAPARGGGALTLAAGQSALVTPAGANMLQPRTSAAPGQTTTTQPLPPPVTIYPPPPSSGTSAAAEYGTDGQTLQGNIYNGFRGAIPSGQCKAACDKDGSCDAWVLVKPGYPNPGCYLMARVTNRIANSCCRSEEKAGRGGAAGTASAGQPTYPVPTVPTYPVPPPSILAANPNFEYDIDRPGSDYRNFELAVANPEICAATCAQEGQCRAWTYVKPGVQGNLARCWLKNQVPNPVRNATFAISGVTRPGSAPPPPVARNPAFEYDIDRPGSDYRNFELAVANPEICAATCAQEGQCRAWTFVKPGVQGNLARCWLKNQVPNPVRNATFAISGLVARGSTLPPPPPPAQSGNWSVWISPDIPDGSADYDWVNFPNNSVACAQPVAVECRVRADKRDWRQTGQRYKCAIEGNQGGGVCLNADNPGGCLDYEVRFLCPAR